MPPSELEAEAQGHVLGAGDSINTAQPPSIGDSREEMRRRILDATMERIRKDEEELEHRCGTTSDSI